MPDIAIGSLCIWFPVSAFFLHGTKYVIKQDTHKKYTQIVLAFVILRIMLLKLPSLIVTNL